jgi:hypothetical protein
MGCLSRHRQTQRLRTPSRASFPRSVTLPQLPSSSTCSFWNYIWYTAFPKGLVLVQGTLTPQVSRHARHTPVDSTERPGCRLKWLHRRRSPADLGRSSADPVSAGSSVGLFVGVARFNTIHSPPPRLCDAPAVCGWSGRPRFRQEPAAAGAESVRVSNRMDKKMDDKKMFPPRPGTALIFLSFIFLSSESPSVRRSSGPRRSPKR